MSLAAVRDNMLRTEVLVYTKPQPTERLVVARFVSSFAQILLILLAVFLGAALSRLYVSHSLTGFGVYPVQLVRAAGALFFLACASYCLASLANTALAGLLVALYWLLTLAGREFLYKVCFPAFTQNVLGFSALGLGLLAIGAWFSRPSRRGAAPVALWIRIAAPVACLLGAWAVWTVVRDGHDPQARTQPALEMMGQQTIVMDYRVPGFELPDQNGKLVMLSDYPDKIMVVGLWSPGDDESVELLDKLEALQRQYGSRGVQPVAVCLGEDVGAASSFAHGEGVSYPVVEDWGTHSAAKTSEVSPLADAYDTTLLPKVVITDRRHRTKKVLLGVDVYDERILRSAVEQRLSEEPD